VRLRAQDPAPLETVNTSSEESTGEYAESTSTDTEASSGGFGGWDVEQRDTVPSPMRVKGGVVGSWLGGAPGPRGGGGGGGHTTQASSTRGGGAVSWGLDTAVEEGEEGEEETTSDWDYPITEGMVEEGAPRRAGH
jgi:hypothetical protein